MRNSAESDETLEDEQHALLHCCKRPHEDSRALWESQMAQAMCEARVRRDVQGRNGATMRWRDLKDTDNTRLALGVAPPAMWESSRRIKSRTLQDLHEEIICITASYSPDPCKGLLNYHLRVL